MPLRDFVAKWMTPLLPDPALCVEFHRRLLDYVRGSDPLFIVRGVSGLERGEVVRTWDGTRIVASDNAPAWWVHAVLFNGVQVASRDFTRFVAEIPTHMFRLPRVPTLSRPDLSRPAGNQGWHAAHLFDAKDGNTDWRHWSRREVTWRFLRNLHPFNLFYVPKPEWRRVGGHPEVLAYIADFYAQRFASDWPEFLTVTGSSRHLGSQEAGSWTLRLVGSPTPSRRRATAPARTTTRDSWAYVLAPSPTRPIGTLLAEHPDAPRRHERLVGDLDLERFVVLADVLYNRCRVSDLQRESTGRAMQADLAWERLEQGMSKRHVRPSGWTGARQLLAEDAERLARLAGLTLEQLVTAALRVVDGPYREACARKLK